MVSNGKAKNYKRVNNNGNQKVGRKENWRQSKANIIDSYLYDNLTQMRLLHSTPKEEKTPGLIGVQLRPGRLNKLKALI